MTRLRDNPTVDLICIAVLFALMLGGLYVGMRAVDWRCHKMIVSLVKESCRQ